MWYVCLGENPINPMEAHNTAIDALKELAAYPEPERSTYAVRGRDENDG